MPSVSDLPPSRAASTNMDAEPRQRTERYNPYRRTTTNHQTSLSNQGSSQNYDRQNSISSHGEYPTIPLEGANQGSGYDSDEEFGRVTSGYQSMTRANTSTPNNRRDSALSRLLSAANIIFGTPVITPQRVAFLRTEISDIAREEGVIVNNSENQRATPGESPSPISHTATNQSTNDHIL